jgi:hypothetical protein
MSRTELLARSSIEERNAKNERIRPSLHSHGGHERTEHVAGMEK